MPVKKIRNLMRTSPFAKARHGLAWHDLLASFIYPRHHIRKVATEGRPAEFHMLKHRLK
jgi:hypothetical protein